MLTQIGFDVPWVSKIMSFISSVKYSLKRSVTSTFYPQRRMRQGDSLSLYLFILCTEWLSSKLNSLHMHGSLSVKLVHCHEKYLGLPAIAAEEADLKLHRPSSSWRSLLKARDVLNVGSIFNADGSVSWSQSSSGSLDIKSAYKVAKDLYFSKGAYEAECSDQRLLKKFWKTHWKLPIPRKIKIFGWRMYHDALPSGQCCWWAKSVLESLNLNIQNLDIIFNCHHPADIIFYCWKHCSIKDFSICLIAFWYIWYNRNRVKHGDAFLEPAMAVYKVKSLANQFYYYNSNNSAELGEFPFSEFEWRKPPSNCIKINCDAAWNSSTRKGGISAIARDNSGSVIAISLFYDSFM
ncbi:hypothetical protein QQ045_012207 [Rhodiola kirilowii]